MQHYANVSINLNQIDRSYHYAIPIDLLDRLQPGALVKVPFNKQIVQGVVLDLIDHPEVANPLEVMELLSDDTVLTPAQVSLAQWLAQVRSTARAAFTCAARARRAGPSRPARGSSPRFFAQAASRPRP